MGLKDLERLFQEQPLVLAVVDDQECMLLSLQLIPSPSMATVERRNIHKELAMASGEVSLCAFGLRPRHTLIALSYRSYSRQVLATRHFAVQN